MDEYNFQKLTPKNDVELNIYENAIDFVFENDDIKNVAISGAYSAGKSSILETYKKKRDNIRFLHISLAHFESTGKKEDESAATKELDKKGNIDTDLKESVLEGKILNQLIHQINVEKIPQTNFKVKRKVDGKKIFKTVFLVLILMLSILHVTMFSAWQMLVNSISVTWFDWLKNILSITTFGEFRLFSGIVLVVSASFAVYEIIKAQKNRNILKKVSVQGNEIEIFQESDNSYFDKYLNEVLYLFENADADVIVFEDMDRYNANQIFQRLREVNVLVNNQSRKKNKKPLRFFYLLRDDIFVSKDRTKFFDYIMPVVPVIDSSNSYDQFIEHFKSGRIFDLFQENFLQDVSLYVDDMRILKNIYNEFLIYNNRINTTEQDYNKLLALIIYKNIFPRDFSDLQLNKGFVYTLFAKKDEFVQQEAERIDSEIEVLRNKLELANNEHLRNNQEVDTLYNPKLQNLRGYYGRATALQEMENEVQKRKESIQNRTDDRTVLLKEEIDSFENEKQLIHSRKLCQVINRENIEEIFKSTYINEIGKETDFNEIKESAYFDLIKYLIRNGYIDETYADYMTYFYENSLTRIDKTFLRSVSDKKAKEYSYELKSPQMVVNRLNEVSYDEEEILNFDLLCFLLVSPANKKQLDRFIRQLRETKNLKFIKSFLNKERQQEQFVKVINSLWHSFFSIMLEEGDFSIEQIKLYSVFTLYISEIQDIEAVNVESCLTDYISNNSTYLNIDNPNIEKLINGFKLIEVYFTSIDHQTANKDLFTSVYENCLYQITFEHIALMLKVFYGIEETADFYRKNYTLISSCPETPMTQYMNKNINEYISVILENCKGRISDDEEVLLSVLNNTEISFDNKAAYIEVLETKIELLEGVEDKEIWELLLEKNLAVYSEDNILEYYFNSEKKLDDTLIEFINSQDKDLNVSTSINNYGEDASSNFFKSTIVCNDLNNDKYKDIIRSLRRYYDSFGTEGISTEKLDILIDLKTVRMSKESLLFIREKYPSNILYFIKNNIDSYVEDVISDENFDFDEMIDVISLDVSNENKIGLVEFTDKAISIVDCNYSDDVKIHILRNNLEKSNISHLIISYPQESDLLKSEIKSLAIEHKATIITQSYLLSIELFEALLFSSNLNNDDKIEFLIIVLPKLDEGQATKYLNSLGLNDYVRLFDRGRPKFEANDVNERLLDIFKDKRWITKYEEDKDDANYYRAFGRKLQEELPTELL